MSFQTPPPPPGKGSLSGGSVPRGAFRAVESLRESNQQRSDIDGLSVKVSTIEKKVFEHDDDISQFKKFVVGELHYVKDRSDRLERSLQSQKESVDDLVNHSLGSQPHLVSLLLRSELNDSRQCVALGFVTLFGPKHFLLKDVLDPADTVGKTVDWQAFKNLLFPFFKQHLKFDVGPNHVVQRVRSVFQYCDIRKLLEVEGLADDFNSREALSMPFCWPFQPIDLGLWDEKRDMFHDKSDSDFLSHILTAFVPVFIWAFNVLKHAVRYDMITIRNFQKKIRQNMKNITKKKRLPASADDEIELITVPDLDFSLGTSVEFREYWEAMVSGHPSQTPFRFGDVGRKAVVEAALSAKMKQIAADVGLEVTKNGDTITIREVDPSDSVMNRHKRKCSNESNLESEEETRQAKRMEFLIVTEEPKAVQNVPVQISPTPSLRPSAADEDDVDDEDTVQLDIRNSEDSINFNKPQLETAQVRLAAHMSKFNAVRRYLAIILDANLHTLSVLGDSLLRRALCKDAHPNININDVMFQKALTHTREILKKYAAENGKEAEARQYEHFINEDMKRLSEIIYTPNEYFANERNTVEVISDEHVHSVGLTSEETSNWRDIRLLVSWFQSVRPVKTAEEMQDSEEQSDQNKGA
ncbi:hypothetical protein SCHPADRAFT_943512 [Schizopora paradoxa]|uniref:Uncharacterized protein n=1 Tax=Schizopora paradoxa TaxID=27342 RepID=A0A0H2RCM4_9AGAM|nr:hypothetical protein SCHPADRAFT_943512 [Schizopora paradoxa]